MEDSIIIMSEPEVTEDTQSYTEPTEVTEDNPWLLVAGLVGLLVSGVAVVAGKVIKTKKAKSKKEVNVTKEEKPEEAETEVKDGNETVG